ncbi:TPA: hypothetical protein I8287_002977 [Kluyvera intermedia]|nr:hypothetical protein [Kluyvera intermedia]
MYSPGKRSASGEFPDAAQTPYAGYDRACSPGKRSASGGFPDAAQTPYPGHDQVCSPGKRSATGGFPGAAQTPYPGRDRACSPGKRSATGGYSRMRRKRLIRATTGRVAPVSAAPPGGYNRRNSLAGLPA